MSRTQSYLALILRSRPSGESNREVWLLTAEAGLLRATVFGGPKSKLRAHAAPFHSGQVWIYHDPVKEFWKISDFDVCSWRPGLRELYERTMTAGALAETVLVSHGGGSHWGQALTLAESVLDALEKAGAEFCGRLLVYFWWRWADILGLQPNLNRCVSCGNTQAADTILRYTIYEGGMICDSCCDNNSGIAANGNLLMVSPGCRRWLTMVNPLLPAQIERYTMDKKTFQETRTLSAAILIGSLGKRPTSWDW